MENLGYLYAIYSIVWAVVFGYVFYLYRKLRREMDLLRDSLSKQEPD